MTCHAFTHQQMIRLIFVKIVTQTTPRLFGYTEMSEMGRTVAGIVLRMTPNILIILRKITNAKFAKSNLRFATTKDNDMPKKPTTSKVLNARDPRGDLHAKAAAISEALTGEVDYTAGLIHALSFTAEYYRRPSKPINYATAPLDLLRDYCDHGYDFIIRRAAREEIERRYQTAQEKAK